MSTVKEVSLIGGERVKINDFDLDAKEIQTFIRLNGHFIVGVPKVRPHYLPTIHVWGFGDKDKGLYFALGRVHFRKQEDGSVIWEVLVETVGPTNELILKKNRAADIIRELRKLITSFEEGISSIRLESNVLKDR